MPSPIDYRQTFLRWHVPTELDPPFAEEPGFLEEILALDSLRRRLLQAFPSAGAEIHRLTSRRRFFVTMPDVQPWLYLPVRVRSLSEDGKDYADLTDLLCSTTESRRSVLLTARSGAGKSTAMLKAFFDCLVGRDPALGGRLPCYLRQLQSSRDAFSDAREGKSVGHEVIFDLLAEASRLPCSSTAQLKQWLTGSPPLLLFLDLNAAADDLRPALAKAIVRFQEYFKGRHRWIVAYRAVHGDATLNYLRQMPWFSTYDLRPLQYEDALGYLGNVRRLEEDLATELARDHPRATSRSAPTAPTDPAQLRQLFDRYGNDADGLISTPLLMHFVSLIGVERAAGVESLAQLYEEVVKEYLDRDYGRLDDLQSTPYADLVSDSGLTTAEGRIKIKVAMARVALAILMTGGGTRLARGKLAAEVVLDRLLSDPNMFRQPDWWPADSWWHGGRYFRDSERNAFNQETRRTIREFSFLRRDGDGFAFLHDSFLYYFAALAVRCKEEPEIDLCALDDEPVRAEWCRKTVQRMHASPELWRQSALFLGGMLTPDELRSLLPPLLTADPTTGWYAVVSQVVLDRRSAGQDDVVLRQVERALRSRASELERYPEAMFPHVYNHLAWCEEHPIWCDDPRTPCHSYAFRILHPAMNRTGRPWLRAETPMPPLGEQVFRCDSNPRCLARYAPREFITGHEDGTVRHWQIGSGVCKILYKHEGVVNSVAVEQRDGLVISGGADRTVRRWRPGANRAEVLYEHEAAVLTVAVDATSRAILSGGSDCAIRRRFSDSADVEVLYRHQSAVRSVAVNGRDGSVVSGGGDHAVRRWLPGQGDAETLYRHDGWVHSVAVDEESGAVLSGGNDDSVRLWLPGQGDAEVLYRHEDWVDSVAFDIQDGAVISAGRDNTVRRWLPGAGEAEVICQHESCIGCVALGVREGGVLSWGCDGTIRRWSHSRGDEDALYEHENWVCSVAVDGRDGAVLLGGYGAVSRWPQGHAHSEQLCWTKGLPVHSLAVCGTYEVFISATNSDTVYRWLPGSDAVQELYRHDDVGVYCVVVDGRDGSVVSGGGDGTVRRWRAGGTDAEILYWHGLVWNHQIPVSCVAVDGRDGSVVSGGNDGTVRRWRAGDADAWLLYRHADQILSIAVDGRDGSVLSAGDDSTVRRWREGGEDAEILYRHDNSVFSIALDSLADSLFSGGDDANLRLFRLSFRDFLMLPTPYSIRSVACSLRHNRIALALGDGRLVLVRVEPSVEALHSYPAQRKNPPPDASSR